MSTRWAQRGPGCVPAGREDGRAEAGGWPGTPALSQETGRRRVPVLQRLGPFCGSLGV